MTVAILLVVGPRWIEDFEETLAVSIVALIVVGAGCVGASVSVASAAIETDDSAHATSVGQWLEEDYGIDVDQTRATELVDGGTVVVQYNGKPTSVALSTTGHGRLVVVDASNSVLKSIGE